MPKPVPENKTNWRLIIHGAASGPFNMAVDEALLCSAESGVTSVRLYRWTRPTLSFGYRQRPGQMCDRAFCQAENIEIVRRITGGRAVLHHEELTYAVTSPFAGPFHAACVKEVYARVTGAIREALSGLGAPVDPDTDRSSKVADRTAPPHLPCLSVPTGHEVTSSGKKLVASAQRDAPLSSSTARSCCGSTSLSGEARPA